MLQLVIDNSPVITCVANYGQTNTLLCIFTLFTWLSEDVEAPGVEDVALHRVHAAPLQLQDGEPVHRVRVLGQGQGNMIGRGGCKYQVWYFVQLIIYCTVSP